MTHRVGTPTFWATAEFVLGRGSILWALVLVFVLGCGSDNGRRPVQGNIVGDEDCNGSITFIPVGDPPRPSATAAIVDGHYEFDRANGPCAGQHDALVVIGNNAQPLGPGPEGAEPQGQSKTAVIPRRSRSRRPPKKENDIRVSVTVPDEGPWDLDIQLP